MKRGPCTICQHPQRHVLEVGLVLRVPGPVLAKRFHVGLDSLYRHRKNHISPQVAAGIMAARAPQDIDLEALHRAESEGLLASLVSQRARLQVYAEAALEAGSPHTAASIERSITANLELVSKLLGMIVQHTEVRSTSILISADYLALRHAIVEALRPFPDAALAVGEALAQLENKAALDIQADAKAGKRLVLLDKSEEIVPDADGS